MKNAESSSSDEVAEENGVLVPPSKKKKQVKKVSDHIELALFSRKSKYKSNQSAGTSDKERIR